MLVSCIGKGKTTIYKYNKHTAIQIKAAILNT